MIEPYESALSDIPGTHPYPRSSRYHDAEIGVHRAPDGTEVRYVEHRLPPPLDEDRDATVTHTVSTGERLDHLGQRYFGDPGQWWRVADANPILDPRELTAEPGRDIDVPHPDGGGAGGR